MILNNHKKNIIDIDSWHKKRPPKLKDIQWQEGRSAMELASYITKSLPYVPAEIENAIKPLVPPNASFDWDAEHVTALPGKGEGRNHDALLYNSDIVVTIEAKADETLGNKIKEELQNPSVNKLHRISELLRCIFPDGFKEYEELRYQLLTASVGTILEAKKKQLKTAVLLVLVFKTNGKVEEEKILNNHTDVELFLEAVKAYDENGLKVIPNTTDVKLYFKEIII